MQNGIPFASIYAAERTFLGLKSFLRKIFTAVDLERNLEKALKDLAMLQTTCNERKVLELQYVQTLLPNTTDDSSFQNFTFNNIDKAKITIFNMLSYRMIKLSDASKAVSKMTHMRISFKQRIRF